MIAIAVSLNRFGKPNTVFKAESFISQSSYRANIYNVTRKIVINSGFDIGGYFRMVAPVQNTVDAVVSDLVGSENTTVAKDATRHVQLYFIADIYFRKCTAVKLITGFSSAMIKA